MYTPPSWAAEPASKVTLEEILNGVGRGEHDISKKSTVSVGRNPELSDVCLDDTFMSRKHAIFQHGTDGRVAIWDLGSTHGTWVNNQRIPVSQFVDLKAGAVIRFGPNTEHLFFLIGGQEPQEPDEPYIRQEQKIPLLSHQSGYGEPAAVNKEKEALEKYLKEQSSRSYKEIYEELLAKELTPKQKQERQNQPLYDRTAVNWGMVDDEIIYGDKSDQEIVRTDLLRALPNLSLKHLARIEDFEKKQKKMKAMIRDFNKIFELEEKGTKLSSDQHQIKKDIEQRMNKLSGEMAVAEDKLKQMFGLDHQKSFKFSKDMRKEEIEDDEFYDRTRTERELRTAQKVPDTEQDDENFAKQLREQAKKIGYEGLMNQLAAINSEILSLKDWLLQFKQKLLKNPSETEEELDKYIKEQQMEEQRVRLIRLKELNKESERVVLMLRCVQPQFDKKNFDEQHERMEEEKKVKDIFREQEKERRKRIFEAMEKRNAELAGATLIQLTQASGSQEVWDSIEDDNEELARLGKRVRMQGPESPDIQLQQADLIKYTVTAKPASRDEESELLHEVIDDSPYSEDLQRIKPAAASLDDELEHRLARMQAKQKSLGY